MPGFLPRVRNSTEATWSARGHRSGHYRRSRAVLGWATLVAVHDAVRDVGDARRLDRADLLEVEVADILEEPRSGAEQDRDQVQLELINQPGGQVLLNGAGASSQQYIPAIRGLLGLLECGPRSPR